MAHLWILVSVLLSTQRSNLTLQSLTLLSFNLLYSQLMNIFPSKHVIIFAVFTFEMGSLVCGVAPTMNVLIFGRALAGAGAAGIFSGGMVIVAELTPLHSRAQYFALFGVW